jgi:hypothetical protein
VDVRVLNTFNTDDLPHLVKHEVQREKVSLPKAATELTTLKEDFDREEKSAEIFGSDENDQIGIGQAWVIRDADKEGVQRIVKYFFPNQEDASKFLV